MIITSLTPLICGNYTAVVAYILQATALDQKVFDFAAPHFKHAFALGTVYALINLTLEVIIRDLTGTTFETESTMMGTTREMESNYPNIYKISCEIAKIISIPSSVYLLRKMNYSVSYRFAAICMIPICIFKVVKANRE